MIGIVLPQCYRCHTPSTPGAKFCQVANASFSPTSNPALRSFSEVTSSLNAVIYAAIDRSIDINISVGNRMMSASPSDSVDYPHQEQNQSEAAARSSDQSEGVQTSAKQQLDSITGGVSVTDIKNNVTSVAGEKINGAKETVLGGAVPAAAEALQSAQGKIRSVIGGSNEPAGNCSEQGSCSSNYRSLGGGD